jgi:DNA-binding NtrC family response regulator
MGWRIDQTGWREHCTRVARRVEAFTVAGEWRSAEAAVRSLRAEAALTDAHVPAAIERFLSGTIARTGRFTRGTGSGAGDMNLLHGVASLLEVVQDATDECSALRHGCTWVREHAGADAAGIVSADSPKWIAGEGVTGADLEEPDVRAALRMSGGRGGTVAEGARAVVIAPMRYGGATIGFAFARGSRDSAESLDNAARALASACAPALRARLDGLAISAASQTLVPEILGRSPSIGTLREAIARAATTMFPVLIEGESGTGKELVARALHRLSPRRDRRFAALNCAALTDELLEAELFGYTRGAFTGAINHRAGLFEESNGSTLFLDEVAELSARAQAKLLRVLQEREIRRVGEQVSRPVDVRVVSATNLPLTRAAAAGAFREDLLFRLAVVRIRVPALRDRIEDVPLLAYAFWRATITEIGKHAVLGPDAVAALCRHRWPGNVRELQNVIAALMVAAPTRGRVTARHVAHVLAGSASMDDASTDVTLECARASLERRMIAAALARHRGRRTGAARELGLSRQYTVGVDNYHKIG